MKKRVIAVLAVLMLASASPTLADDFNPNNPLTPEQKWLLKAGFAWDAYQRGWIATPCENDAFVDLYGEWFGC